jgi:hypothetical protein
VALAGVTFAAKGLRVLEVVLAAVVDGLYMVHFKVLRSSALAAPMPVRFEYRVPNTPWETFQRAKVAIIH